MGRCSQSLFESIDAVGDELFGWMKGRKLSKDKNRCDKVDVVELLMNKEKTM